MALERAVDLQDYEALLPYFSTTFRPGRSPGGFLGVAANEAALPAFDIAGYERATGGHVDYVLAYGGTGGAPEMSRYAGQLGGYELIYTSQPGGRARLYRRRRS